jgi:thiosulfate dehydrogenase [quinone] large subunit
MGWVFLWQFLDKLLGLGFATPRGEAWIDGHSPTAPTLWYDVDGPLASFYHAITGAQATRGPSSFEQYTLFTRLEPPQPWVDWVYMLSMLLIGLALLLGILTRISAIAGMLWMVVIYTATAIWPEQNPFVDEHVIAFLVLLGIAITGAGRTLGFGNRWHRLRRVSRHPILE